MARHAAIAGVLSLLLVSFGPSAAHGQATGPLSCSAQVGKPNALTYAGKQGKKKRKRQKPRTEAAVLRVQCYFQMTVLAFFTNNRSVKSIDPVPQLSGASPGDQLSCAHTSPIAGSCQGLVAPGAVIRVGVRVHPQICNKPRFKLQVSAAEYQQPCAGPNPCPAIGPRIAHVETRGVAGC
jgi:hypothetical protein